MVEPVFFAVATITVISAVAALEAREIVYGALALGVMFISVAGLFILLDASYLAMFQIGVYVGAVVVLILFTVILVKREELIAPEAETGGKLRSFIALTLALVVGSVATVIGTGAFKPVEVYPYSISDVGLNLLNNYGFGFIVLALVLASALIGALTLAKMERGES